MANAYSAGKSVLVEPSLGSYVNSWDQPLNSNFGVIDATMSGTTTINANTITPGVPFVVLTFQNFETNPTPQTNPLAGQNLRVRITGSLTFDVSVLIPSGVPGLWIIDNQTTGNYNVKIATTDPATVPITPTQGFMSMVFSDGVNVNYADQGIIKAYISAHVQPGTIVLYGVATPPDAGYLVCNGSAVSRTTYADLFANIGVSWGAGDGVNTFNIPNLTFATSPATYMIKT